MASIRIPAGGFPLSEFPSGSGNKKSKAPQAIQIESAGGETLEQLIIKMRNNAAEILVSLGKKPVRSSHELEGGLTQVNAYTLATGFFGRQKTIPD